MTFEEDKKGIKKTSARCYRSTLVNRFVLKVLRLVLVSPCSLEMSGLYQNLDVSWTNFTFILMSGYPSVATKDTGTLFTGRHSLSRDRRRSLRLTINGLWDVCQGVRAGQVGCAAAAACHQILVVSPLYVSGGHVPLFR